MRLIDADALRESVLKWLPHDPCGVAENEHPYETDICVSMLMEIEDAPTIEPEVTDSDTISRKQTLEHLKKRLYESALNNDGIASYTFEEIADNRIQIWMDELPPSPHRP